MVTRRRLLGIALFGALVAAGAALWALRPAGFAFADLWLTPDQQGRWRVERGDYADAARRFRDPMWKGVACYRARDLECATQSFARIGNAEGDYNLGIAQAQAGDLAGSLAAFERALAVRPAWRDAQENRDVIARIIAERKTRAPDEEAGEPNDEPDEIKFDEEGKRGKRGTIEIEKLAPDAIDKMWLRNVRTDPAEFLRARFAAESRAPAATAPAR